MRPLRPLAALLCGALVALAASPAGGQLCTPTYDPSITPPSTAIPGWPVRRATTAEINAYVNLVDDQTDRVLTSQYATSWNDVPLYYSLVGDAANVAAADQIAARQERLRRPGATTQAEADQIAAANPALVWYSGNVHGNETSGADAALGLLYELAARTDCTVDQMRDNLLVGVIATQNPDGRNAASRQNAYGFDMNRDWFARTQPEIDGQLDVLERYPPVLFIDAHEMGSSDFFFPPNDDPIHHEISPQSLHWINQVYGPALQAAFEERQEGEPAHWDYFNYETYDLFAMVYGDTVPTTAFTAAGMTFEKGTADPDDQRYEEQFVAGWTSLLEASERKEGILAGYYAAHRRAVVEGRQGFLEPNQVYAPGSDLVHQVPDMKVRSYFLGTRRGRPDVDRLVGRLMEMDVRVYRLTEPFHVSKLQAYGRPPAGRTLHQGTFWIPMDQPQKRWIQAVLGEDPYGSLVYFYDTASWSNPLLMNVPAWFTGQDVDPEALRLMAPPGPGSVPAGPGGFRWFRGDTARAVGAALALDRQGLEVRRLQAARKIPGGRIPSGAFVVQGPGGPVQQATDDFGIHVRRSNAAFPPGLDVRQPEIAVFQPTSGGESYNHMRYFLDQVLQVPWDPITGVQAAAGELTTAGYDVFLVPGVNTADLNPARPQIESWIEGGGVYVGTARPGGSGGTPFAVASGWTSSALESPAGLDVPGSLFRVRVNGNSPVTLGAGRFAYWFNLGERVLRRSTTGANAAVYPEAPPAFWYSGYAEGHGALRGTAGLVDETLGAGHVVLFSNEPNFRAYTEGTQFLVTNALAYPQGAGAAGTNLASVGAAQEIDEARASVEPAAGPGRPIRIRVPAADATRALAVVGTFTDRATVTPVGDTVVLEIPNRPGLDVEEHPFAFRLLPALDRAGVQVLYAAL